MQGDKSVPSSREWLRKHGGFSDAAQQAIKAHIRLQVEATHLMEQMRLGMPVRRRCAHVCDKRSMDKR
jgi:hypothetical protein